MLTAALIVAAGRGKRTEAALAVPKQYAPLAGEPVLTHVVRAFAGHPAVSSLHVVIHPDDRRVFDAAIEPYAHRVAAPIMGGTTRQESVCRGLEALAHDAPDRVLIHDAARPFVTSDIIDRVLGALKSAAGAIAAEPVADTLKRASPTGFIAETVDRSGLWRAQTPQGFHFAPILDAHRRAVEAGRGDFTDDAGVAHWAGVDVTLVAGSPANVKLTTAEDMALAGLRLGAASRHVMEPRTGTGFDVHPFAPGDHVWLCGIRIAHSHGLEGHSDADVGLHALTDALLGAIGEGDIGEHFPPSDPQWKDAASRMFLEDARRRIAVRGGGITNVDITLLCEAPRIAPHRDAMRRTIAGILGIDAGRVAVKATTTEGLGFIGRREGIAALASATVLLPA